MFVHDIADGFVGVYADICKKIVMFLPDVPFMEKVRDLAPERSRMWAPALQQIYFNLGRKAEADQMDAIMESNAKGN